MSLLGLDVGTSAVKAVAYHDTGESIAAARIPVSPRRARSGWEEADPASVLAAVEDALRTVACAEGIQHDPITALAISASGDEAFAVDTDGHPLGPCLLSADRRGGEQEDAVRRQADQIQWYERCGHVPTRMDPVTRWSWWRTQYPDEATRTRWWLGWHEFCTLHLTGHPVTDPSLAAKWLAYDARTQSWSAPACAAADIDVGLLPTIASWSTPVGSPAPGVAERLGLSGRVQVAVGAYDSVAAALGTGCVPGGAAGLACGSWEVLVAPTATDPNPKTLVDSGLTVLPYPGGSAVVAQSPNGASVIGWAAGLTGLNLAELSLQLSRAPRTPSPVSAHADLSGRLLGLGDVDASGSLQGLTLATSGLDIVQAFAEAIARDVVHAVGLVQATATPVTLLRAAGGGTTNPWWMQLKSDLTGLPLHVVDTSEPGCFGAALLAGSATGVYTELTDAATALTSVATQYLPDPARAALYRESTS